MDLVIFQKCTISIACCPSHLPEAARPLAIPQFGFSWFDFFSNKSLIKIRITSHLSYSVLSCFLWVSLSYFIHSISYNLYLSLPHTGTAKWRGQLQLFTNYPVVFHAYGGLQDRWQNYPIDYSEIFCSTVCCFPGHFHSNVTSSFILAIAWLVPPFVAQTDNCDRTLWSLAENVWMLHIR